MSYSQMYRALQSKHGGCPLEAGLMGKLADNECKHGRLDGDNTPPCGCFPWEAQALTDVLSIASPPIHRRERQREAAVAALAQQTPSRTVGGSR